MNRKTKITAYILVMFLISSLITAGIFASAFNDVTEFEEAIDTLNSIGVITGRSATQFSPDDDVTRWQMALLMSKLLTGDTDNRNWETSPDAIVFNDVVNNIRHYGGSIAYAVRQNLIIGRSEKTYAPEDGITLQDAATIAVRALGYPRSQYDAGYPESYIEKADSLGLFLELENVYPTETLTRGETAQLLYNVFKAPKRIGNTIAEDIFEYNDATVVLTATEDLRISSRVSLAEEDTLVFCELNTDGTVNHSSAFSLDAADFDFTDPNDYLGKSYRVTSVMNYENILTISECESEILNQNMISDLLTVVNSTSDYIKLGNIRFDVVSKYSYDLEENITPQSNEIIIYGVGESYEPSSVLSEDDIYGTNAYYTLTTYDDNGDGYPDRALYRPYSFALYTKTGTNIKLEGASVFNLKSNEVTLTGTAAATGNYILYSYIPDAAEIDILKVMTVNTGTVVEYDTDSIKIKPVTSTAGTEYAYGNEQLRGAYYAAVRSIFTADPTVSYIGSSIKYITDNTYAGLAVLMLSVTDPGGNNTTGYVSQNNCAVVRNVDTTNIMNGYITLSVYYMNGTVDIMHVKAISNSPVGISSMNTVAAGDFIEYAVYQAGSTNADTFYNIANISAKPYVSSGENNTNLYYLGADTVHIGIGYKTSAAQANVSYYGTLPMGSGVRVLFYNGIFEDITNAVMSTPNYLQQILPNYSMYASYGIAGVNAKLVYIRPKYIAPANNTDTSEFSRILFLSTNSINNMNPLNGVVYYPNAFDFIGGKYVTAEYTSGQSDQIGYIPQQQGYYKASVKANDESRYLIKEHAPIATDISNVNIVYDVNTTLEDLVLSQSSSALYLGGIKYTTASLNIYKFTSEGIVAATLSEYTDPYTTWKVDVFMKPADTNGNSARIALLIR